MKLMSKSEVLDSLVQMVPMHRHHENWTPHIAFHGHNEIAARARGPKLTRETRSAIKYTVYHSVQEANRSHRVAFVISKSEAVSKSSKPLEKSSAVLQVLSKWNITYVRNFCSRFGPQLRQVTLRSVSTLVQYEC